MGCRRGRHRSGRHRVRRQQLEQLRRQQQRRAVEPDLQPQHQRARRHGRHPDHAGDRRRRLHGPEHQLLLDRLPEPAHVEPPALHLPGGRGPDHDRGARPGHRRAGRHRQRPQVRGDHPYRRGLEHQPAPPGHGRRRGARREALLQPDPALRRPAGLQRHPGRLPDASAPASAACRRPTPPPRPTYINNNAKSTGVAGRPVATR